MKCNFCKDLVSYTRMAYHLRMKHKDKHRLIIAREGLYGLYHTENARQFFRRQKL